MIKTIRLNENQLATLIGKIVNEQFSAHNSNGGELLRFANDYIENINDGYHRMMYTKALEFDDYGDFLKNLTDQPYEFTDEEKRKLDRLKPVFEQLSNAVAKIDAIIGVKMTSF